MSQDRSGKITYFEFAGLVREELKLGKAKLAEVKLEAAWSALDVDKSGFITVGRSNIGVVGVGRSGGGGICKDGSSSSGSASRHLERGLAVADEFGHFMAKGAPEEGLTWKEKLQLEQDEKGRLAREEKLTANGRRIIDVEPASFDQR